MKNPLLEMSVNLVTAHLSQSRMESSDVPTFIREIHSTLKTLAAESDDGTFLIEGTPVSQETPALTSSKAIAAPVDSAPQSEAPAAVAPKVPVTEASQKTTEALAEMPVVPETIVAPQSHLIAFVRENDLSDPAFQGLDPWLASRVTPKIAAKLNRDSDIHPSVYPDKLICLEDGHEFTLLRSCVKKRCNMTVAQYIEKWNLPDDYPMAPPQYIERKRQLAVQSGLGHIVRANRERPRSATQTAKAEQAAIAARASNNLEGASDAAPAKRRGRPPASANTASEPKKRGRKPSTTPKNPKGAGSRRTLTLFEGERQPA